MTKDQVLIRAKDIGLIISVVTLFGMLFGPLKKFVYMEAAAAEIPALKKELSDTREKTNRNELNNAVAMAKLEDISKQIDQVLWQLRRMRDDRR